MSDPLWYREAVIYQLHVRAFRDSDADGTGDFRGLTSRLEYLQDLGVTALWLLPFYPSPLRDDGYDIAGYVDVHPSYGSLDDFRRFLDAAHQRGLRVITELVINHTSDQHPWFQRARRAPPESPERDFYVWSDTPDRYDRARIIFKDFETSNWSWDPVAKSYYWHRFYSHQPDLNFDNPRVRESLLEVLDFWLGMGVDGMRLDAVPYLFEREGTSCENLPETHAYLKELRAHVDRNYEDRMLLAEANQWPEDAVAYFGDGDECHMAFHFPIMPRLFMSIRMEDRFPIADILDQTPPIPESCQWAIFLRNHDELTLEMVAEEERDYMYRSYAREARARINLGIRRRLAPLLESNRKKMELMKSLLFSLPGTPVIYYGDEIGMGDNIYLGDRDGVRTPMQWSGDRNAGFSDANPQKLYLPVIIDPEFRYEAVNVEAQQRNPSSLLWWVKRLVALRKRYRAFAGGDLRMLSPENPQVIAFFRTLGEERILVVANLSRFAQPLELDLSEFEGMIPVELFGQRDFPRIGELPYFLTLGPHAFYWFSLETEESRRRAGRIDGEYEPPTLAVPQRWTDALEGEARERLEAALPDYLRRQRWFAGKARGLSGVRIVDLLPLPEKLPDRLCVLEARLGSDEIEHYLLPLSFRVEGSGEGAVDAGGQEARDRPPPVVARVEVAGGRQRGRLVEATGEPALAAVLLELVADGRQLEGEGGILIGHAAEPASVARLLEDVPEGRPMSAEQSHSSIRFGDRLVLKLFRKLEPGESPEVEIGRQLARVGFRASPPVAGHLEYRAPARDEFTLGVIHGFVSNQGDVWEMARNEVGRFLERELAAGAESSAGAPTTGELLRLAGEASAEAAERIGGFAELLGILGRRTGELHAALARASDDPAFQPEPFGELYQRSLYQSLRSQAGRTLRALGLGRGRLPGATRPAAEWLLGRRQELLDRFGGLLSKDFGGWRIRCHGDYHLGQVLFTGEDFCIIDFEGEPARSIETRRLKRSPLVDVAGMLRSLDYAVRSGIRERRANGRLREEDEPAAAGAAATWYRGTGAAFLAGYLGVEEARDRLPAAPERRRELLEILLLAKALYEVGYEMESRPDWLDLPLAGVQALLER